MPDTLLFEPVPVGIDPERLAATLRRHVADTQFPCLGAKSALNTGMLSIHAAWRIDSAWDDVAIHEALRDWSAQYRAEASGLRSFAVVFSGPVDLDEEGFEAAMWDRLNSFAAKDAWRGQPWDPAISSDPEDPHFSLSFGGEAYFVVGLHPRASRPARRLDRPAMVFNLHDQFERLREQQRYEKLRAAILARDARLAGSINPMLARHGESSEARQYSGRMVDGDWKCPFRNPRR